jgi:hypothetical protein
MAQFEKTGWLNLQPISVVIDGDVALVHFFGLWLAEDLQGNVIRMDEKRFEVFRKVEGKWKFIGGMVTPTSAD